MTPLLALLLLAAAQADPLALQQQAVARIDGVVDEFRRTGDLSSAPAILAQAASELAASNQRLQASGDWASLANGLIKQGHTYRMQGQWAAAIALYEQAEAAARQAGHRTHESDALSWRALAAVSAGQVGRAFGDVRRSVQVAEAAQDQAALVRALDVLATVQIAQRDLAGAAETVDREVALAMGLSDPLALYYAYLNRSDVQLKVGERCDFTRVFEACYAALDRAASDLELARAAIAPLGYRGLEQSLTALGQGVAQRRAMVASIEKTQAGFQSGALFNARRLEDVLVTDRFVAPPSVTPPELAALAEDMRRARTSAGGFSASTQARADYVEGLFNEMSGNHDAALDFFLKATASLDRDRQALRDERSRGTFLEDRIEVYYAAIQQLLERKRHDEAFELFERSRSRALADLLASRGPALRTPREQELFGALMLLRTRIADAQGRVFELAAERRPENDGQLAALQARIRTLESEHDQALARIAAEAPRLSELASAPAVRLRDLQRALAEDRAELVQYLVLEHAVLLWHITADSVTVRNVFLPRPQVTVKVAALRRSLTDRNGSFDTTTARQLYLYLIAPIASSIRSERLVIIPHDDLHQVPFQALQAPDGSFLGERAQLSYAPSAAVLLAMRRSPGLAGGRLLAIADPSIDAAPGEVSAIAAGFAQPQIVTDRLAAEGEVRDAMRNRDIIHLAVHGTFDAAEPMLSYLALSRGGGDDGRLTAAEMFGLPLDGARLVVLSACETGRAESTHANELMGMARALIFAGAGALVLSHWEVDSAATAEWMKVFYAEAANRPLAEAARTALQRLKARPEYQHPYYWAAFTLIGR